MGGREGEEISIREDERGGDTRIRKRKVPQKQISGGVVE